MHDDGQWVAIGEILLRRGLAQRALEEGLRHQTVYGGRIGTNLIELGSASPDEVSRALAAQHRVPAALARHLTVCAPHATKLVSRDVAAWFSLVPVGFTSQASTPRSLVVCFRDPRNAEAFDLLARSTGLAVGASVASEYAVYRAIESIYGVPFRRVHAAGAIPLPESPSERLAATRPSARPGTARVETVELDDALVQRGPVEVVPRPRRVSLSGLVAAVPASEQRIATFQEAIDEIRNAPHRQEVLDAVLAYLRGTFGAGLVLVVRVGVARGEVGCGAASEDLDPGSVEVILSRPSMLRPAFATKRQFRGVPPTADNDTHRAILAWFGLSAAPAELVVSPVAVRGRVVCLIYAHMIDGAPLGDGPVSELATIATETGNAFARLIAASRAPQAPEGS